MADNLNNTSTAQGTIHNLQVNTPVNPLDVLNTQQPQPTTSDVVKNIVSTETAGVGKTILGAAPKLDKSLLDNLVPPTSTLLTALKASFSFLLIFSIVSILFFTSQLTDRLDFVTTKLDIPNTSKNLATANQEIISLQTNLNVVRFLRLKSHLDQFSQNGDIFIQNFDTVKSHTAANKDKTAALQYVKDLKKDLRESFITIRSIFQSTFAAPLIDQEYADTAALQTMYEQELRLALNNKASFYKDNNEEKARREYKNYSQAINLVGGQQLANAFITMDFDAATDQELYAFIKNVNTLIVNDLTIIQEIKNGRIKWSDIINEIALRTGAVDQNYTEDFYNELGGIRYTSYDFDSANKRISIIGETKRFDTTNFTMIADLIDELNRSGFFENAGMKSFSKSGSLENGYTATLKLDLDLQQDEIMASDKTINPTEL
ncbi:hypothetical protein HYW82_03300 [Candidatus Peregrinibacteria bacterium]|nr:hypothetical protein [Candidatus Peregrinibacteria bacterium]